MFYIVLGFAPGPIDRLAIRLLAQKAKSPALQGGALHTAWQRLLASGSQGLAGPLDHGLQRLGAGVLIGVEAFAVAGDTVFVDDGKAEGAFAGGHDQAVHGSESVGEGADGILSLDLSCHD